MSLEDEGRGVFWHRKMLIKGRKYEEQPIDGDWDLFQPSQFIGFKGADVDRLAAVLGADSSKRVEELVNQNMDLQEFKNLCHSVLATDTIEAVGSEVQAEIDRLKKLLPHVSAAEIEKEFEGVRFESMFAGTSARVLKGNSVALRSARAPDVLKALKRLDESTVSVDSDIARKLRWGIVPLTTDLGTTLEANGLSQGKLRESDPLSAIAGGRVGSIVAIPGVRGTALDPRSKCACELVEYSWNERFNRTWNYTIGIDYPCGVKWCKKKKWGVTIKYPCGVKWCTASVTFSFSFDFQLYFQIRVECDGILIHGGGSATISASAFGKKLTAKIIVYVSAGAGLGVDITAGSQAGKCLYGAELVLGVKVTVGGYTLFQGSMGYDFAYELPCAKQLDPTCG